MKKNKPSKHSPKKARETDIPSFNLGVLSPHSPKKQGKSAHAIVDIKHSLSLRQIRVEARTKQKYDFDAGESSRPIKQAERKRKEIVFDDDFVEDVPIGKPRKKAKVAPSSKTPKKKKNSKKAPSVKSPKNVRKQLLVKNGHFFASHNVDYEVLRFQTLCDPSIASQIKTFLSPNGLKLFKKTCFAELKGERLIFGLREFAVITGLRCHTEVTDFGYTPNYVSKIMSSYFPNKFTNINESPEELSEMSLPDKVEYIIEEVEHVSKDPKVDAPPLEPKESTGKEDKESILRKISKLKRGFEKVDEKLEKFRKDVFEELGSLRVLINESVKTVLQVTNNPNDQVDAKNMLKVHLVKKIIQHVLIYIRILKGQLMKRMQRGKICMYNLQFTE
uniref:Uncharacterized protein LOC104216504 n=1 Tax=Nicotiana sylvestris TaxID=4096 RepID=A0A1U7VIV4_NICSY|nr:PREDICTED: uncharacterized protein LOC104216504 [Nicotiana sylvestris]